MKKIILILTIFFAFIVQSNAQLTVNEQVDFKGGIFENITYTIDNFHIDNDSITFFCIIKTNDISLDIISVTLPFILSKNFDIYYTEVYTTLVSRKKFTKYNIKDENTK